LLAALALALLAAGGYLAVLAIDYNSKATHRLLPGAAFRPSERYLAWRHGVRLPQKSALPPPITLPETKSTLRLVDANKGRELFWGTCVTCHGRGGEGMPGYGKDLVASRFVAERDDAGLVDFVKQGRSPWDPLNTTKVQMPPRGGNPMLSDADLRDIVAFIRELQKERAAKVASPPAATAGADQPPGAPATVAASSEPVAGVTPAPGEDPLLARSVIPRAVYGTSGLDPAFFAAANRPKWKPPENASTFFGMYFSATVLHGVHVLLGTAVMGLLVVNVVRRGASGRLYAPVLLGGAFWWWLTACWLALFPAVYL